METTGSTKASAGDAAYPRGGAGDFLAAERTFLAWVRTGIALMGFGFILARFGIFLQQIQWVRQNPVPEQSYGVSVWLGVTLVAAGVVVNIAATVRHLHLMAALRDGGTDFSRPSKLAIGVAVTLACFGVITTIYLVMVSTKVFAHP
jgi:putative membrane protein